MALKKNWNVSFWALLCYNFI